MTTTSLRLGTIAAALTCNLACGILGGVPTPGEFLDTGGVSDTASAGSPAGLVARDVRLAGDLFRLASDVDLALLGTPQEVSVPGSSGIRATSRRDDACDADDAFTNLVRIENDGTLSAAACAEVERAWTTPTGLVVLLEADFEVVFVDEDDTDALGGSDTADISEVQIQRRSAWIYAAFDGSSQVVGLVRAWEAGRTFPIVHRFLGATDAGKLVFTGVEDHADDEGWGGDPIIFDPSTGRSTRIASSVSDISEITQLSGNFLIYYTNADVYFLYDVERDLRYSLGNDWEPLVALDDRYALLDEVIVDLTDGSKVETPVRAYGTVRRCTPSTPCAGGETAGAMLVDYDCADEYTGFQTICHLSADGTRVLYGGGVPDSSEMQYKQPDSYDELGPPDPQHEWVADADSHWIFAADNVLTAIAKADGTTTTLDTVSPLNLVYFDASGANLYYAGETPGGDPVFRRYELSSGTDLPISRMAAEDRILPRH